MRHRSRLIFLTFVLKFTRNIVLSFALNFVLNCVLNCVLNFTLNGMPMPILALHEAMAATTDPSPDFQEEGPPSQAPPSGDDEFKRSTIDLGEPPPGRVVPKITSAYFHPYRRGLTARLASVFDTKAAGLLTMIGVQYHFSARNLRGFEAGADLVSDGTGTAHVAQRFIFARGRFRPFAKAGLGLHIIPADQLVTFIRPENYMILGALGFEQLVWGHSSVRAEAETSVSGRALQAGLSLGYVWAW